MRMIITLLVLSTLVCCTEKKTVQQEHGSSSLQKLKYAEGFTISTLENATVVEVTYPFQGATSGYKYLLVPRGESIPAHNSDMKVITTPISSIVCTSTTHIPLLDYLGETDKLVGFPTTDYISSEKMRR
ncbi:MAG: ABC transporter substrate-binding protein, partial [Bacteroidota bacterium]